MKVALVCYEDTSVWILGKLAKRLRDELIRIGVDAEISSQPDSTADINHHIIYTGVKGSPPPRSTTLITHVDTLAKVELLRRQMAEMEMGICLSSDTVHKLVALGIPRDRLCAINYPSPQSGRILPRRIHVGVTSNVYNHGSKREYLLAELAPHLAPNLFTFHIMGRGWECVVHELRARGIEVVYEPTFDEERYRKLWQRLDYYLYLGQDEGSTGLLDALEAGIPTITTPQGFHLDLDGGITHAVTDLADLKRAFAELARRRTHLQSVAARLSWPAYAREHADLWARLLDGRMARADRSESGNGPGWPLPAMPADAGPGGAVHRPRLLLVTSEDVQSVVEQWTLLWSSMEGAPTLVARGVGEEVDQSVLRISPLFEVRVADVASWPPAELSVLSLDFDCVAFWNCFSVPHLDSLSSRRKPNYLMRSTAIERLASFVVGHKALERLVGPALFRYVRRLDVESRAKVASFIVGPSASARMRQLASQTDLGPWWSSMSLVVRSDDAPPDGVASLGAGPPTIDVPAAGAPLDDVARERWRRAFLELFRVMAAPREEERPSEALQALRRAQSAIHRSGR